MAVPQSPQRSIANFLKKEKFDKHIEAEIEGELYLFLVLLGRTILATESLLLVSPVPSWPYLFQPKDQRTLPWRWTVQFLPRLRLILPWWDRRCDGTRSSHQSPRTPPRSYPWTEERSQWWEWWGSNINYPMETSMGAGWRVTMSVGVSQDDPV